MANPLSWSGLLWHEASPRQLAEGAAAAAPRLAAVHPEFQLRRFVARAVVEGDDPQVSDDLSDGTLQQVLEGQHHFVLLSGTDFEGPALELGFHRRSHEIPSMPTTRYWPPEARMQEWVSWGGVTFNVHTASAGPGEVRAAFEILLETTPELRYASLTCSPVFRFLHRQRTAANPAVPVVSPALVASPPDPRFFHVDRLGWLSFFGERLAARLGLPDRLSGVDLGAASVQIHPTGVLISLSYELFDPTRDDHLAGLAALYRHLPGIGQISEPDQESRDHHHETVDTEARAALARVRGKVLGRVLVLQNHADGEPVDPGHGPLELHFDGGARVHTWPEHGRTALRSGPLPEHQARWTDPHGRVQTLQAEDLPGAPLGAALVEVAAERSGFGSSSDHEPTSWELHFDGGPVLRASNLRMHQEAHVSFGDERPERPELAAEPSYSASWETFPP